MSRVYNFSAGPAVLPEEVLAQAREELPEWRDSGMSVMEMSHRGRHFSGIAEQAEADLRALLGIDDNYSVLFMQGGASAQFALLPMNLASGRIANYVNTGQWSAKAIKAAGIYCDARVAADASAVNHVTVPPREEWDVHPDAAYVHYTPNETIGGLELHEPPQVGGLPLAADMSSTLLSRPIDVSRFGVIYAGAQKNIGPAGITIVIVANDLLKSASPPPLADVFSYSAVAKAGSMLNTPPTYAWYVAGLVFQWLLREGGLAAMGEINRRKADLLYQAIDGSDFYANPIDPRYRSWMNVPFTLVDPGLESVFLSEAQNVGLVELKGHRSVGGMRASIYNAMPVEGVTALIAFMAEFEQRHG